MHSLYLLFGALGALGVCNSFIFSTDKPYTLRHTLRSTLLMAKEGKKSPHNSHHRRSGALTFAHTACLSVILLNPLTTFAAQTPEDVKLLEGYKSVTKLLDTWEER